MFPYLVLTILCLIGFHVYIHYSKFGRAINKIPGPPGLPILGNILQMRGNRVDLWNYVQDKIKRYPSVMKCWVLTRALVLIRDPDDVKIMLTDKDNIKKSFVYDPLHMIGGNGLITSHGDLWQYRRKILTPAFHINVIKKYIEVTFEQGQRFVQLIKSQGDETVQNIKSICSDLSLSIILEAAMGTKFEVVSNEVEEYKNGLDVFLGNVTSRSIRPYIQDWMLRFYSEGRRIRAHVKHICNFADKVIEERRKYHNQANGQSLKNFVDDVNNKDSNYGESKKRLAMLDLLLLAEKEGLIDDEGIKAEVNTFIAAGYDTVGMAMHYALMLLAENQDKQELARVEVNRILAASGGKITMIEIQQMEYMERIVKETLRLFPTAPNIVRTITKDIQLKNYIIPAGSEVYIPIFFIHRLPEYWPDPLKFDPDRFLPEEVQKRHPSSYIPFSSGLRNCIGQRFAIAEMKIFLAQVLHNFRLEPVTYIKDMQFELSVVLVPTKLQFVKFIKIKKQ